MRLKDRVAVVTGAASGIGRAIAKTFAREGAHVLIADVRRDPREGGEPTEEVVRAEGGDAVFVETDMSRWEDIDRLIAIAVDRYGRLDIMCNNAAITNVGIGLLDATEADWERIIGVNLRGTFFGCKRAVQQMLTQDVRAEARGRIVNVSSLHGILAAPSDLLYGVSKSGVVYMTRQIAADFAKQNIICNAVAPGKIVTGKGGRSAEPNVMEYSRLRTPFARLGTPSDVANAALFLASDEATYITGINLLVDGGWSAS